MAPPLRSAPSELSRPDTLLGATLDVAFQPILHLESLSTFGFEVLGRARCERTGDAIAPNELLARAEARGELLTLDRAWRALAIEHIARERPPTHLHWFFNVDTRCADDPGLTAGFTRNALRRAGLDELRVVIELGERDPALDRARLARLAPHYADEGFAIALDDLGAGHASLNRLVELRPDVAKLDMALLRGVDQDRYRAALIRALVQFGEDVGMPLVAEGIETMAELDVVRALGVPYGQGFLLGRPRPLDLAARLDRISTPPPPRFVAESDLGSKKVRGQI